MQQHDGAARLLRGRPGPRVEVIGVFVFREPFGAAQALGFAAIWTGLLIFAGDGLWRSRQRQPVAATVTE